MIYYSASGSPAQEGYEQVDFETLLTTSDIVSVHAPLNEYTKDLMDREAFAKMKKTAIFLNLGRGPIVVEQDLYEALETGEIAAAGLDVLCEEPMSETNPLAKIKDSKNAYYYSAHCMGECGSKKPIDADYCRTDQGIFINLLQTF